MLLALAVALLATYRLIGSDVDADGLLHEPFALVPLAWLCGLASAFLTAIGMWRNRRHSRR